jgi:hypothetical protein
MNRLIALILVCMLLAGCSRQQHLPKHFVILIDTSASIEPEAETECIQSILKLIEKMERGDKVTIIPITGDADIESTGRVLRFQKPTGRVAYDADLVLFSKLAQKSLTDFQAWAIGHPARKTDILGGIRMATEEFATTTSVEERTLIIFSDFIEDDGSVHFNIDHRLISAQAANRYAAEETKASFPAGIVPVHANLGLLRSKELHALNKGRREAIKQFWLQYLRLRGIKPIWVTDGVGLLTTSF